MIYLLKGMDSKATLLQSKCYFFTLIVIWPWTNYGFLPVFYRFSEKGFALSNCMFCSLTLIVPSSL